MDDPKERTGGNLDPDVLHDELLELAQAVAERFGDREPTQDELHGFLEQRLRDDGKSHEEAAEILRGLEE